MGLEWRPGEDLPEQRKAEVNLKEGIEVSQARGGGGGGHSRQRKLLEVNEKKKKRAEHGMCWRYVGD